MNKNRASLKNTFRMVDIEGMTPEGAAETLEMMCNAADEADVETLRLGIEYYGAEVVPNNFREKIETFVNEETEGSWRLESRVVREEDERTVRELIAVQE